MPLCAIFPHSSSSSAQVSLSLSLSLCRSLSHVVLVVVRSFSPEKHPPLLSASRKRNGPPVYSPVNRVQFLFLLASVINQGFSWIFSFLSIFFKSVFKQRFSEVRELNWFLSSREDVTIATAGGTSTSHSAARGKLQKIRLHLKNNRKISLVFVVICRGTPLGGMQNTDLENYVDWREMISIHKSCYSLKKKFKA